MADLMTVTDAPESSSIFPQTRSKNHSNRNIANRRPTRGIRWKPQQLGYTVQGDFGTCVLLASAIGISFETGRNKRGIGFHRFTFYRNSYSERLGFHMQPVQVQVRDNSDLNGGAVGTTGLLETAWVQFTGKTDILRNGAWPSDVLPTLTGSSKTYAVSVGWSVDNGQSYSSEDLVEHWLLSGRTVLFESDRNSQAILSDTTFGAAPLVDAHAYRVLTGGQRDQQGNLIFDLINPWGQRHSLGHTVDSLVASGEKSGIFYAG